MNIPTGREGCPEKIVLMPYQLLHTSEITGWFARNTVAANATTSKPLPSSPKTRALSKSRSVAPL